MEAILRNNHMMKDIYTTVVAGFLWAGLYLKSTFTLQQWESIIVMLCAVLGLVANIVIMVLRYRRDGKKK